MPSSLSLKRFKVLATKLTAVTSDQGSTSGVSNSVETDSAGTVDSLHC